MIVTSNTELYSLSLNTLCPNPPEAERRDAWDEISRKQSAPESQDARKAFRTAFVNQYSSSETSKEPDEKSTPKALFRRHWSRKIMDLAFNWWGWEIICWSFSTACVISIGLLLGFYDGKKIPSKWPLGMTLNTCIAILGAATKFSLAVPVDAAIGQLRWHWFGGGEPKPLIDFERFDDATRGPWGALVLLVRCKGRLMVSIGMIITLFTLTLDPLFQQLVAYRERPNPHVYSSVPRMINYYTPNSVYHTTNNTARDGSHPWIDTAIMPFLIGDGQDVGISAFCPSGDCAWRVFDTLGLCSQCADISDKLDYACAVEDGVWKPDSTGNSTQGISCGYFFNSTGPQPVLMSGHALTGVNKSSPALLSRFLKLQDVNTRKKYWDGSINFKNAASPIIDFALVASSNYSAIMQRQKPTAQECVVQWCTKRMAASYQNGAYLETLISTYINNTGAFDALEFRPDSSSMFHENITIIPPEQNRTFSVHNLTAMATVSLFQDIVPAYMAMSNDTAKPTLQLSDEILSTGIISPRLHEIVRNAFGPPNDVPELLQRMCTAATNIIRNDKSSESFEGPGSVGTYIHVRWGFIAWPVVLLALTICLLVGILRQHSQFDHMGIWKTSSLAILAHGLNDHEKYQLPVSSKLGLLEESARLKVKLVVDGDKGYFTIQSNKRS